jgi:pantoate--beta-alanine ligase
LNIAAANLPLTVTTEREARRRVLEWQAERQTVALVPTMGNLHRGHISLVEKVQQLADRVVCSVFVNPTQFGPNEDFEAYPRTLREDEERLAAMGIDLIFAPTVKEMYPFGDEQPVTVTVPGLSEGLCGASRPGHFTGVATVVCRLLNIVRPDFAVFGEKDYQQLLVLQRMVEDLRLPVEVIRAPIVRQDDGLALSSRNRYLTAQQRQTAPLLNQTLGNMVNALRDGRTDYIALEAEGDAALTAAGFRPDYLEVRMAEDIKRPSEPVAPRELIVLAAAWLGETRLLDNRQVGAAR